MRFFGKRANRQSTKSEVPPELQAYYTPEAPRRRWRRAALFVLPVLALLLLIGGILWAIAASRHQKVGDLFRRPSTSQQQQQGTTGNTAPATNRQAPGSTSQPSGGQPAPTAQQPQTGSTENQQGAGQTSQTATPGAIPNTGPDEASLVGLAAATTSIGTTLYHAHQIRRAKRTN